MEILQTHNYWCHICKKEFNSSLQAQNCTHCASEFIEKIEGNEEDIKEFEPYNVSQNQVTQQNSNQINNPRPENFLSRIMTGVNGNLMFNLDTYMDEMINFLVENQDQQCL